MKYSAYRGFICIAFGAFFTILCCFNADAGKNRSDQWHFQMAPYMWPVGQKVTVATLPGLPPADVDIDSYDDVFGNIKESLMLVGEARKGRLGSVMDIAYTDMEMEEATPGPFFTTLTSRTKSWIASGAGFYRLVARDCSFVYFVGGLRYFSVDSELPLSAGIAGPRQISNKERWVDPIIGLKGFRPIGQSKFFSAAPL